MLPRKPMDLRQLRYFQAVAAAGRITSAARELGITQPALSIALAKLEADLGVVLFDRDHRGVHLTESGRTLLTVVTQAMSLIEQGRQALTGLENEPVGRFVMGCPSALGCYLLPGLLPGLLEAFPRVELVIRAQTSRDVEAAVANRDVHFGLCTHPPQTADLVMLELFRDEVCVITPVTGGPAAAKAPRSWGEASALLRRSTMVYASAMPQAMEILDELTARNLAPAKRHGRRGHARRPRPGDLAAPRGRPSPRDPIGAAASAPAHRRRYHSLDLSLRHASHPRRLPAHRCDRDQGQGPGGVRASVQTERSLAGRVAAPLQNARY
jgi:DNA-binding transcriptional LysR family regulator